jgi:hypothetical protein
MFIVSSVDCGKCFDGFALVAIYLPKGGLWWQVFLDEQEWESHYSVYPIDSK